MLVFFIPMTLVINMTRQKINPRQVVLLSRIFGIILAAYGLALLYQGLRLL